LPVHQRRVHVIERPFFEGRAALHAACGRHMQTPGGSVSTAPLC
jgi:hypothetical protein